MVFIHVIYIFQNNLFHGETIVFGSGKRDGFCGIFGGTINITSFFLNKIFYIRVIQ